MKQRLRTLLNALTSRMTPTTDAGQTDEIAALTDHQQDLLKVQWWRWRHCFLELKRLQLEQRHTD